MRQEGGPAARIEALIAPLIADMGYVVVRVKFISGARPRLQIMAERADGSMDVEDCARLSRAVSALLDVEDPISSEYVLEVSSPGIDRPLVRLEDFARFEGYEARIELARLMNGRKRYRGVLNAVEGEEIILVDEAGAVHRLPFALIEDAKLVLTDALIAQALKAQGEGWTGRDEGAAGQGQLLDLEGAGDEFDIEVEKKPRKPAKGGAKPAGPKTRLN